MSKIYVVKDIVADVICSGPFLSVNDGVILRQFMDMLNGQNPVFDSYRNNPSDYEIWYVGDMDEKTGFVTPAENPSMLHRLSSIYTKEKSE